MVDQELHWVDVHLNKGDKLQFNKIYNQILDFFAGHADSEVPN